MDSSEPSPPQTQPQIQAATGRVLPVREALTVHEFLQLRHVWRDYLDAIPGVRGSFIGYKYVNGIRTNHLAIVVVVDRKIPENSPPDPSTIIALNPNERILSKLSAEIGPIKEAEEIWALTDVISGTHSKDLPPLSASQLLDSLSPENRNLLEDLRSSTFEIAGGLAICSKKDDDVVENDDVDEDEQEEEEDDTEDEDEEGEGEENDDDDDDDENDEQAESESIPETTTTDNSRNKQLQETDSDVAETVPYIGSVSIAVRHRDYGLGVLTSAHVAGVVSSKICHPDLLTKSIGSTFVSVPTQSMLQWMGTPFKDDEETTAISDCAFVRLPSQSWDKLNQRVHGIKSTIQGPRPTELDFPDWNVIGSEVIAVGAGSGLQQGHIVGVGYRYFQDDDTIVYVDYIIANGSNRTPSFSMYGDEGKLIILKDSMQPLAMQYGRWEHLDDGRFRNLDALKVGKRSDIWTFAISLDKILASMHCEIMSTDSVHRLIQQLQQMNYKSSGWNYCSIL